MNAQTKHTPGPWRQCGADKPSGGCTCRMVWSIPADSNVATGFNPRTAVACVHGEWGDDPQLIYGEIPTEQVAANARLIAAAPDMYEALRRIVDAFNRETPLSPAARVRAVQIAEEAIAKATGEVTP